VSDVIVGASLALSGVVLTAVIGWVRDAKQFSREKWWKHYEDQRGALERVYVAIEDSRDAYHQHTAHFTIDVARGRLIDRGAGLKVSQSQLTMLSQLYAPEVGTRLPHLRVAARWYSDALLHAANLFRDDLTLDPEVSRDALNAAVADLQDAHGAIDRELDKMTDVILSESTKLRERAGLMTTISQKNRVADRAQIALGRARTSETLSATVHGRRT